ncbi:MAG: hypothetical protein WC792_05685 [Candidatus Micrarchaeia archaeon]|jgi:hypothetical protein
MGIFSPIFRALLFKGCRQSGGRKRAQTAIEYLLLIALGVAVVVMGVAVAGQLKGFSDILLTRVGMERNTTIAMLLK